MSCNNLTKFIQNIMGIKNKEVFLFGPSFVFSDIPRFRHLVAYQQHLTSIIDKQDVKN